jgi:hypothetical protein
MNLPVGEVRPQRRLTLLKIALVIMPDLGGV